MQTKLNQAKFDAVASVKASLESCRDVIFTDYRGLNVAEISDLRSKLRENATTYRVVKNSFTRVAMKELGWPEPGDLLIGPTALALVESDAGPAAKVILEHARDTTVRLKGGIIDGKVYDLNQIEALSNLPGRDQLISMLMSTMNAPLQNLVYAMNGVAQKLVRVLKAVADKKQEEE